MPLSQENERYNCHVILLIPRAKVIKVRRISAHNMKPVRGNVSMVINNKSSQEKKMAGARELSDGK